MQRSYSASFTVCSWISIRGRKESRAASFSFCACLLLKPIRAPSQKSPGPNKITSQLACSVFQSTRTEVTAEKSLHQAPRSGESHLCEKPRLGTGLGPLARGRPADGMECCCSLLAGWLGEQHSPIKSPNGSLQRNGCTLVQENLVGCVMSRASAAQSFILPLQKQTEGAEQGLEKTEMKSSLKRGGIIKCFVLKSPSRCHLAQNPLQEGKVAQNT